MGELAEPADDQFLVADRKEIGRQGLGPVLRRIEAAGIGIVADLDARMVEEVFQIDRAIGHLAVGQTDRIDDGTIEQWHGDHLSL